MTEPVPTRAHRDILLEMLVTPTAEFKMWALTGSLPALKIGLSAMFDLDELAEALATVEHNARREAEPKPPVYPEMVDGQHVKQPTPAVLVEIAPSGFAEGLTYGPLRYEGSRLVKYVLAPPELPSPPPGGASGV